MYQIGVTKYCNTRTNKEILVGVLGEMLGYLDANYIKTGRTAEVRERMRRTREFQKLVASVGEYNIDAWISKHAVVRLLTMSGKSARRTVGVIAGYSHEKTFVIDTLYVQSEYRRIGVAGTGMRTLVSELRVSGYDYIIIEEPFKWMLDKMPEDINEFVAQLGFVAINTDNESCKWAYVLKEV